MRLPCPLCGERDLREFYYQGAASMLDRPEPGADLDHWHAYLHLRDNPAGETQELWYHQAGCGAWMVVMRDTRSHVISGAHLVETRHAD